MVTTATVHLAMPSELADTVTPGVLGFLVIFAVGVALYFLMKSMRRNLANVRVENEDDNGENGDGAGHGQAGGRAAG